MLLQKLSGYRARLLWYVYECVSSALGIARLHKVVDSTSSGHQLTQAILKKAVAAAF